MSFRAIALGLVAFAAAQAAEAQTPPQSTTTTPKPALTPPKSGLKLVQTIRNGERSTAYLDEGSLVSSRDADQNRILELWLLEVFPVDQTTAAPPWSAEWTHHSLNCTHMNDRPMQTNFIDMTGKTLRVIVTPTDKGQVMYAGSIMSEMAKTICNPRFGYDGPRLTSLTTALQTGRATSAPDWLKLSPTQMLDWRLVSVTDTGAIAWADAKAPPRDKWPRVHVMIRYRQDVPPMAPGTGRTVRTNSIALELDCAGAKARRGLARYFTANGGNAGSTFPSQEWEPFSNFPEQDAALKQACKTSPANGEAFSGAQTETQIWLQSKLTP